MSSPRLVDPSLFADGDKLSLVGSRCVSCATVTFPLATSCPRCAGVDVHAHDLPSAGTLWAFTDQLFPPKAPYAVRGSDFRPFVVGYVDLDGEVIVESRIVVADRETLRIGQQVRLITETFTPAGDIITFAFTPEAPLSRQTEDTG